MGNEQGEWQSSPRRYFGKRIEVTVTGDVQRPASFTLDGVSHLVAEILFYWQDYGFGKASDRRHTWRQRHHRNYYRVRTTDDEVFEMYHDRGTPSDNPKYRRWYLTRQF